MKLLVNAAQLKAADQYTIQELGIASLELMERAANACVQTMQSENLDLSSVCVVCGSGNNGGDGFAIARILKNMGCSVDTYLVGNPEHCTPETREQIRRLKECGGKITEDIPQDDSYSIVIDAVFGVGLSRKIEGRYRQVIERMNQMQGTKFAVDIPSGLSASTGCVLGCAFHADDTVTFEVKKIGLELAQGRAYAGRVTVAEIGISHEPLLQDADVIHSFGREEYHRMLPERPEDSNKGSYGRLLVIAGSKGMAGAAYLNAHAAYMTGAGLVRIYTPKDNREILQTLLPEAIITAYDEFNKEEVKGKIYGTNVRCLLKLLGTPFMPDLEDAVLFLEGCHSNIIQWNAMLEQYNQMNAFNKAIVFGYIYQLQQIEENEKMIVDELRKINSSVPVVKTNDFGHMHANSIIPIGAEVIINANNQSIVVSEYLK